MFRLDRATVKRNLIRNVSFYNSRMPARSLPDPRVFAQQHAHPMLRLAAQEDLTALVQALRIALQHGRDSDVTSAFEAAPPPPVWRLLCDALVAALEPEPGAHATVTRLFALPVLVVTGGAAGAEVPAVLPAVERVRALFEANGALGPARNFGLSSALCDAAAIERVPASRLYRIAQGREESGAALDLPPAPIVTASTDEEVHLRFLAGAAVTPVQAPSFLETGADIGGWGMALTRELAAQLEVEGLSLLPIPRPPMALPAAPMRGRQVREELAFQAFVSRVLRQFRSQTGDPHALVAPVAPAAVGVRFSSPFDPGRVDVFHWALTPLDRIEQVQEAILALLRECRLDQVELSDAVLTPAAFAGGRLPGDRRH
jgi:hypothetical protein